jgi:peroxiredoxin
MLRDSFRVHSAAFLLTVAGIFFAGALVSPVRSFAVEDKPATYSDQEKPIVEQLRGLRKLPNDVRAHTTKKLALQIRQLPVTPNKLRLAGGLANLSTEGDFGYDTLQEVANTLGAALREQPQPGRNGEPDLLYVELASLARYERVQMTLDTPQFAAATAKLEADDAKRQQADFTLSDLQGKNWNLKDLRGKIVLLNFWATWCPPCWKEMPDLEALYSRFKDQGLVVLAISDEDAAKVSPFLAERNITYPVLLDLGRKVNEEFQIEGIPKSFV